MIYTRDYYIHRDILAKNTTLQSYMELPWIHRIVIHSSTKRILENPTFLLSYFVALMLCTGQKPTCTRAKKSIARFRLRTGQLLGCKVTLRRILLKNFITYLSDAVLPNSRDFPRITIHTHEKNDTHSSHFSFGIPGGFMGFPQSDELYDFFEPCSGYTITITIRKGRKIQMKTRLPRLQQFNHVQDSLQSMILLDCLRAYGFPFSKSKESR